MQVSCPDSGVGILEFSGSCQASAHERFEKVGSSQAGGVRRLQLNLTVHCGLDARAIPLSK